MINKIKSIISTKYYTYVPGEFLPVFSGSELINKRAFHIYKAKRAAKHVHNYLLQVRRNWHALQTSRA